MTVSYKKSGPGGGGYYTSAMTAGGKAVDDYYSATGGKELPGAWYAGARSGGGRGNGLGIEDGQMFGAVPDAGDARRFGRFIQGFHPETGAPLVQNAGDRGRIALHDFTLSAPKSVSVVWSMADGELKSGIEAAQQRAAREMMDLLGEHAYTRQGKGGVVQTPAALIGALFGHGSSREHDPHLHTHCVAFNLCERPDGTTGALQTLELMRWQGAAASLAHARLAWELRNLGLAVEKKGKLFEIAGVPEKVLKQFSKRRRQIEAVVQEELRAAGIDPAGFGQHGRLHDRATLATRQDKSDLNRQALQQRWLDEGAALGFTTAEAQALVTRTPVAELTREELLQEARLAVAELTGTKAVFRAPELLTQVAVHLLGRASPGQIRQAVEDVKAQDLLSTPTLNKAGQDELLFTTREMLLLERRLLRLARRPDTRHVLGTPEALGLPAQLTPNQRDAAVKAVTDVNAITVIEHEKDTPGGDPKFAPGLLPEQRKAALNALSDGHAVSVIEGTAGAGKTFTVAAISREFERHGYKVTGLASSWTAAINLQASAQLQTGRAITGWLQAVRKGQLTLNAKTLIVMDEAGMVGARDMVAVLDIAKTAGAKVILIGDTLQQKSIAAGDALRVIAKAIGSTRLDAIFRQKDPSERQAVYDFFAGRAKEGLATYAARDLVHFAPSAEAAEQQLIEAWMRSRQAHGDKQHLIMASDNVSVRQLNNMAHAARQAAGSIGPGLPLETMDCLEPDDRVEVSVGDDVVFRVNAKEDQVFNRSRGVVERIEAGVLFVRLTGSNAVVRVDPKDEKWRYVESGGLALQLGYCISTYSAQGLTADLTFLKDSTVLDRASAGVGMSRHREGCQVFVDKALRHQAKMRHALADEWTPLSAFTDEECLARMAAGWSAQKEKTSTLDYAKWEQGGARVDAEAEEDMQRLRKERLAAGRALARLRLSPAPRCKAMPFQEADTYVLPIPRPPDLVMQEGSDWLTQRHHVHPDVAWEAVQAGFVSFEDSQTPVFIGYRPGSTGTPGRAPGQPVCLLGGDAPRTEALRHQFPPVLPGDDESKSVDIVSSGLEALQLQTLQILRGEPRSTVIVSSDQAGALLLPHIRALLERAAEVHRHDVAPAARMDNTAMNAVADQEAASQAHANGNYCERADFAAQARKAMEAFDTERNAKMKARQRRPDRKKRTRMPTPLTAWRAGKIFTKRPGLAKERKRKIKTPGKRRPGSRQG
ncbi:MobF family relaxase [Polaromonas glacialis]|uniref:MobF family relaxase n=1 Tax=Polaromonas glacialis TaxID=866564 RepID=UPI00049822CE|nr:MobF family relaxase [Polaromonas glacialis]